MQPLPSLLSFPSHFRFGTSVSAFQVEGNDGTRKSDWDIFLAQHSDIVKPHEIGAQWWEEGKAEADIDRLAALGMQVQRFGMEWARIEPEEGIINHEALKRYRQIVDYLHKQKIKPLITLNHYTLPEWIAKQGSWENSRTISAFEKYTQLIATEFGDVTEWLTLNEPNALVEAGYLLPFFPPQRFGIISALTARKNMLTAHRKAYAVLKQTIPQASVSMAFAFRWYRPENRKDPLETKYAHFVNYLDSLNYIDGVKDSLDFIGVNFYAGYFLNLNLLKLKLHVQVPRGAPPKTILFGEVRKPGAYVSDLGAPIVPDFFLDLIRVLSTKFHKPIMITENGIVDRRDYHRSLYLLTHLVAVWKAMKEGIPINQYLVWSPVDNLEWLLGYREQFGLIHVDSVTGERTLRKSAHLYRDIVKSHEIDTTSLLQKYLEGEQKVVAEHLIRKLLDNQK